MLGFEWDTSKEVQNIRKHGISFEEAAESFFDSKGFEMVDVAHSFMEPRFYWIGKTVSGKILTTWFTRREDIVRIIGSAQWRRFRRLYNEATQIE